MALKMEINGLIASLLEALTMQKQRQTRFAKHNLLTHALAIGAAKVESYVMVAVERH